MIPEEPVTHWSPGDYLSEESDTSIPTFALVVLNQPIADAAVFTRLWKNAKARVCADGGANHLFGIRIDGEIPIPDCITGDLDSITDQVRTFYQSKEVEIIEDQSEYDTDFTKSLKWIYKHARSLPTANGNGRDGSRGGRRLSDALVNPSLAAAAATVAGDSGPSGDAHHADDEGGAGESDERRKRPRVDDRSLSLSLSSACSANVATNAATADAGGAVAAYAVAALPADSATAGGTSTRTASSDTNDNKNSNVDNVGDDYSRTVVTSTELTGASGQDYTEEGAFIDVVAYGATGGRVDQSFQAINQLFVASQSLSASRAAASQARRDPKQDQSTSSMNVIGPGSLADPPSTSSDPLDLDSPYKYEKLCSRLTLVTDESLTFLLEPGKNTIKTPLKFFGKTCGIIPVAGPSMMTTRGLEWDLEEYPTRFGGMVSSSNHLVREDVEVVTTEFLLWTMEIRRSEVAVA